MILFPQLIQYVIQISSQETDLAPSTMILTYRERYGGPGTENISGRVMPGNTVTLISSTFQDTAWAELSNSPICVQCSIWCSDDSFGQNPFISWHSRHSFVSRVFISTYLSFWRRILRTLLILENHRCQTWPRSITKFCPLMLEPLPLQHCELWIDVLKFDSTFWYCKRKFPLLLNKVYRTKHMVAWTKWLSLCRRHFQMIFIEWKGLNSD